MEMTLCKPCAMGMAASGKKIKQVAGRNKKITCANCGRRRYGVNYDVAGREEREGNRE